MTRRIFLRASNITFFCPREPGPSAGGRLVRLGVAPQLAAAARAKAHLLCGRVHACAQLAAGAEGAGGGPRSARLREAEAPLQRTRMCQNGPFHKESCLSTGVHFHVSWWEGFLQLTWRLWGGTWKMNFLLKGIPSCHVSGKKGTSKNTHRGRRGAATFFWSTLLGLVYFGVGVSGKLKENRILFWGSLMGRRI